MINLKTAINDMLRMHDVEKHMDLINEAFERFGLDWKTKSFRSSTRFRTVIWVHMNVTLPA